MLERDTLNRLRKILESVRDKNGGPIPFEQVMALSAEERLRVGVTIDFQASDVLGAPLVFLHNAPADTEPASALEISPAELRVAALIAAGLSNKEIARRLGISVGTVKDHVHHILQKNDLPNRASIAVSFRRSQ